MSHYRLRGVGGVADVMALTPGLCAAQLPLIREADRLAAEGNAAGAITGYVAAARSGCPSPMLDAAVGNVLALKRPSWLWLAGASALALGAGILIGRASKRGRR